MKKLFAILILLSASTTAHSFQYYSGALNLWGEYAFLYCGSRTDANADMLISSFSLNCIVSGPGYIKAPYYRSVENSAPYISLGLAMYSTVPHVTGTHTIRGIHTFWVQEVCGIVKVTEKSIYWPIYSL